MSYVVDFSDVSTVGLESSPVTDALAGLRAKEARYFSTRYGHTFVTVPAPEVLAWVTELLALRDLVVSPPALKVSDLEGEGIRWAHVFYESGLAVNALWTLAEGGKARRRPQALRRDRGAGGAGRLQVRPSALEARRHDPRLLSRRQGRAPAAPLGAWAHPPMAWTVTAGGGAAARTRRRRASPR